MSSRPVSGIKIIEELEGTGPVAEKGDEVEFAVQGFLNRGECIQERTPLTGRIGARQYIAGVEYSLIGMRVGGYRKVRISPHLAYRDEGVPDKIPADAVLIYEIWLRGITSQRSSST